MHQIGRRIFRGFLSASILMCVAIVVIWIRSYPGEYWRHGKANSGTAVIFATATSQSGRFQLDFYHTVITSRNWLEADDMTPSEDQVSAVYVNCFGFLHDRPNSLHEIPNLGDSDFSPNGFKSWEPGDPWCDEDHTPTITGCHYSILFPDWAWVGFFALPALVATTLRIHRFCLIKERERLGLCQKCGYDVRESTERCPECGAVVVA